MTKPEGRLSLVEFAASLKPGQSCRVCELAEVAEINAARKAGVSLEKIARWLIDVRGLEPGFISVHRVARHFSEKHDA